LGNNRPFDGHSLGFRDFELVSVAPGRGKDEPVAEHPCVMDSIGLEGGHQHRAALEVQGLAGFEGEKVAAVLWAVKAGAQADYIWAAWRRDRSAGEDVQIVQPVLVEEQSDVLRMIERQIDLVSLDPRLRSAGSGADADP